MTKRICLAVAVILGLASGTLAASGLTASHAAACENHTS